MKLIFEAMNTTKAVVKIKPEKKIKPLNRIEPVSHRLWLHIQLQTNMMTSSK